MFQQNIIVCISLLVALLFSFSTKAAELTSKIESVTVFINGAQIMRTGNINLKPGQTIIECKGISPYINTQSLSVKGLGNFKIFSTGVTTDFDVEKTDNVKIDSSNNIKLILKKQTDDLNAQLNIVTQIETLVQKNSNLSDKEKGVSTENLKAMINLYKTDLLPVIVEKNTINNKLDSLKKVKIKLTQQLRNIEVNKTDLPKIIVIEVDNENTGTAKFEISYFVDGASWQPIYDVRVDDLSKPIQLISKANVTQVTGEDWENVQLTFSSGQPNIGGEAPQLLPWYLSYRSSNRNYGYNNSGLYNPSVKKVSGRLVGEFGDPIIGANIIVDGTTVGTTTDIDGYYNLNIPMGAKQLTINYVGYESKTVTISKPVINIALDEPSMLDEIVVVASRSKSSFKEKKRKKEQVKDAAYIEATVEQTPTVLTFKVDERFTILSKNESKTINLAEYKIDATYTHYAVPKIEPVAYLIASINNWNRYNLLQGEANIYFENTFITETIIDAQTFNDTLSISLGPDRNVAIKRVKDENYCVTKMLSSNVNQSIGFNIDIRNNRKQLINLECYDQIPISEIDDIKIKSVNLSKGNLNEKTGIVKWKFELMPDKNKQLQLAYEVKYPKGSNVTLE